jgi:UDPglucose--hexose-1-phosphate uridylyltransferase
MHELRKDPLFGRWVAVRQDPRGPGDYARIPKVAASEGCPFCGADAARGRRIWSVTTEGGVLSPQPNLGRRGFGMYDLMHASGMDETIVESPEHGRRPEDLGAEHMGSLMLFYRDRVRAIEEDARIRSVLVCMDSDPRIGARFDHPHSRLLATPIIPLRIKSELDSAKEYFTYKERCIFCDIIEEELRAQTRVVLETEHFLAFCPFAPKFAFEFWVIPRRHECMFKEMSEAEAEDLGQVMAGLLTRMRRVLGDPPFSYVIHSSPNRIPRRDRWHTIGDDYHWHIEVMPRMERTSGMEAGSGFYAIGTSPEEAARHLREG